MADPENLAAGVGTSPDFSPARQDMMTQVARARQAGVPWEDIAGAFNRRAQMARDGGATEDQIRAGMGLTGGETVEKMLNSQFQANLDERGPVTGVGDAFKNALEASSGGIVSHLIAGTPDPEHILPQNAGMATRLAYNAGTLAGDIPAMIGGAMLGSPVGALAGGAVGASVGPEGAVAGAYAGASVGSSAGAFALPEFIKQTYANAVTKGEVTGPADFAERVGSTLWNTAKQAAVGGLTSIVGKMAEGLMPVAASTVAKMATKTSAELATMTTASAALQGKLPTVEDVTDAAILIGGMHGAIHASEGIHTIASNVLGTWAKTDMTPAEIVRQAQNDPVLRQQLVLPQPEEPPAGSSETPTSVGNLVVPKQQLTPPIETAATETPALAEGEESVSQPSQPSVDPWAAAQSRWAIETQPSFLERVKKNLWSVYRELFRPDYPINLAQDAFEKGASLEPMQNPKFLRRMAEISGTTARYMVERGMIRYGDRAVVGRSLNDIVKPWDNEVGPKNFWNYALARRTLADVSKDTGLSPADAAAIVKEGQAKYEETFKELLDWRNGTLTYARDTGLLSAEDHANMVENAAAHLPIYRQEAEGALEHAGKGGKSPRVAVTKETTSEGSSLPILNMRANLMRDAFRRSELGENNRANIATADMMEKMGLATRISTSAKPIDGLLGHLDMADLGGADYSYDQVIKEGLQNLGWTFQEDTVPMVRDGNVETWRFADPEFTRYMKGMDAETLNTWQRVGQFFAKFQRNSIVLNPLFPIKLLAYDVPWQFITKPGARNVLADLVVGMRGVLGDTGAENHAPDSYDGWLRSGGAESVFDYFSKNQYIQSMLRDHADPAYTDGVWNVVKGPYRALQTWGASLSKFQRAGRYIRGVRAGESMIEAGAQSSEAAFHRLGFGGPAGKELNKLHPFFSAYLNSLDQSIRAQFGIGTTIGGEKYNGYQTTMKAVAMITLPVLGAWAAWHNEEWYKAVPDQLKDAGIPTPWGFIPLPPPLNFFYGALPRRLMEKYIEGNPHAMDHLLSGFGTSLLPPMATAFTANAIEPIMEKFANFSFFRGRPLEPPGSDTREPAQRWSNYSTETSKSLAKFLSDVPLLKQAEMSPPDIDNMIQGYAGTLGIALVRGAEQAATAAGLIKPNAPAWRWTELPLLSSWTTRYPNANAQPILDFKDRFRKSEQVAGSLTAMMGAGDTEGYKGMAEENPAAAVMHRSRMPIEAAANPNTGPFKEALQGAAAKVMADPEMRQNLQVVMQAHQALDNLGTAARFIGALPNDEPLSLPDQQALSDIVKQIGAKPTGKISANDKRQLLDMTYSTMQVIAEHGIAAMDKVKLK